MRILPANGVAGVLRKKPLKCCPCHGPRVPHTSLVFCEMWDTTALNRQISRLDKSFHERSAELQIPPLRYASVGMTKERAALPSRFDATDDEQQVSPLRYATSYFVSGHDFSRAVKTQKGVGL